jgi:hypothetical protein
MQCPDIRLAFTYHLFIYTLVLILQERLRAPYI